VPLGVPSQYPRELKRSWRASTGGPLSPSSSLGAGTTVVVVAARVLVVVVVAARVLVVDEVATACTGEDEVAQPVARRAMATPMETSHAELCAVERRSRGANDESPLTGQICRLPRPFGFRTSVGTAGGRTMAMPHL
jgi:hypothetical protein